MHDLHPDQSRAVDLAMVSPMCLISGPPGSGKSTILRVLAERLRAAGSPGLFLGVTGKCVEVIKANVSPEETVMTIDMLLTLPAVVERFSGGSVIVDEASMLSVLYLHRVFGLSPSRLVLVGDRNQLPPVGRDGVMSDLMNNAAVPHVVLTRVFRQKNDTALYRNLELLRSGKQIGISDFERDDSFNISSLTDYAAAAGLLCVAKPRPLFICLTNAAADKVNAVVQQKVNPNAREIGPRRTGKHRICSGDTVRCVQNTYDRNAGVAGAPLVSNGTMGVVTVDGDHPRVEYENGYKDEFDFKKRRFHTDPVVSYAMTTHTAQGSQAENVVGIVDSRASRALLYTMCSRAKDRLVVIANDVDIRRATGESPPPPSDFSRELAKALSQNEREREPMGRTPAHTRTTGVD